MNLINYRDIACDSDAQWKKLFAERYTIPNALKGSGRVANTKWMVRLNKIRDDDFDFLELLNGWFVEDAYDDS